MPPESLLLIHYQVATLDEADRGLRSTESNARNAISGPNRAEEEIGFGGFEAKQDGSGMCMSVPEIA